MADRENPLSWPATEGHKEITKWYDEEFRKLRGSGPDGGGMKAAFHAVERRTDFPEIFQVPGGLPANTETPSKTILGANFGTVLADVAVTINGVAATVTALATEDTITFTCPALGLVAGDVVMVDVAIAGVREKISVAVA